MAAERSNGSAERVLSRLDLAIDVDEAVEDLDRARTDDHDEQSGKDAKYQREHDLHGRLLCLCLDRLTTFDPELRGLRSQAAQLRIKRRQAIEAKAQQTPDRLTTFDPEL